MKWPQGWSSSCLVAEVVVEVLIQAYGAHHGPSSAEQKHQLELVVVGSLGWWSIAWRLNWCWAWPPAWKGGGKSSCKSWWSTSQPITCWARLPEWSGGGWCSVTRAWITSPPLTCVSQWWSWGSPHLDFEMECWSSWDRAYTSFYVGWIWERWFKHVM